MINQIDFKEISVIWSKELWPGRKSPIEPFSCLDINGNVDMKILDNYPNPKFFSFINENKTIAVTSLHNTSKFEQRLRGTWVAETYRRSGIGTAFVQEIFKEFISADETVWTLSRVNTVNFYKKQGLSEIKLIEGLEFGPHVAMLKKF